MAECGPYSCKQLPIVEILISVSSFAPFNCDSDFVFMQFWAENPHLRSTDVTGEDIMMPAMVVKSGYVSLSGVISKYLQVAGRDLADRDFNKLLNPIRSWWNILQTTPGIYWIH